MFTKCLAALAALFTAAALAGVDVNKASLAEIEAVKGIGTDLAARILDERSKGPFKDWADLVGRVKGIGVGNAAKFSAAGLSVGGAAFTGGAGQAGKRAAAASAATQ